MYEKRLDLFYLDLHYASERYYNILQGKMFPRFILMFVVII